MTLEEKYKKEVIPTMMNKFGYKNKMAVPKIEKVVINCGIGKLMTTTGTNESVLENIKRDLAIISGQIPQLIKSKKSISAFKLRKGMPVAFKITLRGRRMYDFLFRLIHIALPRTRDFRGLEQKSFDEQGNLTIGIREHIVFPEVIAEEVKNIFGFEITICTNASSRQEAIELLKLLGFPIKTK